jgi:hypothetical protein
VFCGTGYLEASLKDKAIRLFGPPKAPALNLRISAAKLASVIFCTDAIGNECRKGFLMNWFPGLTAQEQPQNPVTSRFGCEKNAIFNVIKYFAQKKCPAFHFAWIIQYDIVVPRIFKHANNVMKQETIGI